MKIGRIPIAAITLLLVALARWIAKLYSGPLEYANICLILDGVMVGVLLTYLFYYANIYFTAWYRNRKESKAA